MYILIFHLILEVPSKNLMTLLIQKLAIRFRGAKGTKDAKFTNILDFVTRF